MDGREPSHQRSILFFVLLLSEISLDDYFYKIEGVGGSSTSIIIIKKEYNVYIYMYYWRYFIFYDPPKCISDVYILRVRLGSKIVS